VEAVTEQHMGWLISVKGWEHMATHPKPYYAHTESEKDWYLANSTEPGWYDVTRVPDPLTPQQRAEREAFIRGPAPAYCPVHQHYKWCEHNGGVPGPAGYGRPPAQG
jgi:hypothetical protein